MPPHLGDEIHFRRALPSDTPRMLEITRDVWDGTDYLPYVGADWLKDAIGYPCVALMRGQIVGLQHIDLQPEGTAWLEGIRVAPDCRNRGIGRALLGHGIAWATSMGCARVRLSAYSGNEASNRIGEQAGLTVIRAYDLWSASPLDGGTDNAAVRLAGPWETDEVLHVIDAHDRLPSGDLLYTEGWTARTLTAAGLAALIGTHAVAVFGGRDIEGASIATANVRRSALRPGLFVGSEEALEAIAAWIRSQAGAARLSALRGPVYTPAERGNALERAGFVRTEGATMVLRELTLSGS